MKKTKFVLLALSVILVFSLSACVPTDDEGGNETSTQVSDVSAIALESEDEQKTDEILVTEDENEPDEANPGTEDEDGPNNPVT